MEWAQLPSRSSSATSMKPPRISLLSFLPCLGIRPHRAVLGAEGDLELFERYNELSGGNDGCDVQKVTGLPHTCL